MKLEQVKVANRLLDELSYVEHAIDDWKNFEFIPLSTNVSRMGTHVTIPAVGLSKEAMSILSASAVSYLELQRKKLKAELDEL